MHEVGDHHVFESILAANDELADHNRDHFQRHGMFVVNIMSAPGAGKTALLCASIPSLGSSYKSFVIEGDMVGELDCQRLAQKNIASTQISTGRTCHLDASMIARLMHAQIVPEDTDILFIENVGNLVCPAEFPLGEHKRVVLLSVTEGDDKPLKYPIIFRNCDAVVFTKCDLLPYVNFDLRRAAEGLKTINSDIRTFALSVETGQGLPEWLEWLKEGFASFGGNALHRPVQVQSKIGAR